MGMNWKTVDKTIRGGLAALFIGSAVSAQHEVECDGRGAFLPENAKQYVCEPSAD